MNAAADLREVNDPGPFAYATASKSSKMISFGNKLFNNLSQSGLAYVECDIEMLFISSSIFMATDE